MFEFKKGQKVLCVSALNGHLTEGNVYTVIREPSVPREITVIDDRGKAQWFFDYRFKPVVQKTTAEEIVQILFGEYKRLMENGEPLGAVSIREALEKCGYAVKAKTITEYSLEEI